MTPIEARKAVVAWRAGVGPQASVNVFIQDGIYSERALSLSLYPGGVCKEVAFRVEADTFEELLALAEEAWEKCKTDYAAKITRTMALEIIRLTAEHGECTDAALRATFSVEEVARFGKAAVKDANSIASNGPFAISIMKGANAA